MKIADLQGFAFEILIKVKPNASQGSHHICKIQISISQSFPWLPDCFLVSRLLPEALAQVLCVPGRFSPLGPPPPVMLPKLCLNVKRQMENWGNYTNNLSGKRAHQPSVLVIWTFPAAPFSASGPGRLPGLLGCRPGPCPVAVSITGSTHDRLTSCHFRASLL